MTGLRRRAGSTIVASVRLVEVAALQEVEVAVVVLDAVVELQVVLHDLGRGVALRPGVVGEREDDEARRPRAQIAFSPLGSSAVFAGCFGTNADEPRVERQAALAVAQSRTRPCRTCRRRRSAGRRGCRCAGRGRRCAPPARIVLSVLRGTSSRRMSFGWNGPDHGAVGPDDVADDLRLVELAAVGEGRVGVDQLDRRDDVVALADPGLVDLAREDLLAERRLLPGVRSGRCRRPRPAGRCRSAAPNPYWWAQWASRSIPSMPASWKKNVSLEWAKPAVDRDRAPAAVVPLPEPASGRGAGTASSWTRVVGVILWSAARRSRSRACTWTRAGSGPGSRGSGAACSGRRGASRSPCR